MTRGTLRTSVVAAYPSSSSCRIGATTMTPKRRGSCRSSISSFQTSSPILPMSAPLTTQAGGREREHEDGENSERRKFGPDDRQSSPLQDDAPQRAEEIAGRHDIGH